MKTKKANLFYRNAVEVQKIEPGALWRLDEKNRVLVLVDEDQHITIPVADVTMLNFFEVESPPTN